MIIQILAFLLSIPLGFLLAKMTKDEKHIYSKSPYFPVFLWVLIALSAVFLTLDQIIGKTLLFTSITMFFWYKAKP